MTGPPPPDRYFQTPLPLTTFPRPPPPTASSNPHQPLSPPERTSLPLQEQECHSEHSSEQLDGSASSSAGIRGDPLRSPSSRLPAGAAIEQVAPNGSILKFYCVCD